MAQNTSQRTKKLALSAIFCALAFLTTLLPAPKVNGFLSFDIKDTVLTLAGLLLGPSVAVTLSFAVPLFEMATVGSTLFWGLLMDIVSSLSFSLTASLLYKSSKTLGGAILALSTAVATQVATMMVANIIITPLYTGAPRSVVLSMLIPVLLPFNALKSVFNASLVMALYKPTAEALRSAGLLSATRGAGKRSGYRFDLRSAAVLFGSLAMLAAALLVLFLVLDAAFVGGNA